MNTKIEGAFLLKELNQSAMAERVTKDHPGNMHLWWNRSPINASKKILSAAITLDDGSISSTNDVVVIDPFSGFGGLTLAAVEMGLPVVAGDLNSVATILTKAAAEIPARFSDLQAVSPDAENRIFTGVEGLAEDINCYGTAILSKLKKCLVSLYPEAIETDEKSGKTVYAWIWTRTVTCPNPACGCKMPLVSSYVLSKQKQRECYAQPEIQEKKTVFRVVKGVPVLSQQGNKIGSSGAKFKCPACGEITTDDYVKHMGCNNQLGRQLVAVGYEGSNGKTYESPSKEQIRAAFIDPPSDTPLGEIPANTRWFSPPLFGVKNYYELFSPRQLVFMTTLCNLVNETREVIFQDAKKAGLPDDNKSLSKGGCGALAYSEAVSVYLTLVVDKIANFQSEVCTWDNRNGNVRAAFTRQAIPMTWVYAEGNPFSSVTGNFVTMLQDVVRSVKNLPCCSSATVAQGDGTKIIFPQNSILFTELPYYDNVGYADLSDYFYIWMRRCLKNVYPDIFEKVVTSKDELTSIPEHYDGDAAVAKKAYENGIRRLCLNFAQGASPKYPSLIFFEFGKADVKTMMSEDSEPMGLSGWENLSEALIQAGFQITAILPVRTEKPNDHYETLRVCTVFRKRSENAPQTTRRGFVNEIKKVLPGLLEERFLTDIEEWDKPIVGMGCGLSLFTRYKRIINADGTNMNVHDGLRLIWTEVAEYLKTLKSEEEGSEVKED